MSTAQPEHIGTTPLSVDRLLVLPPIGLHMKTTRGAGPEDPASRSKSSRNSAAVGIDKIGIRFQTVPSIARFVRPVETGGHTFRLAAYGEHAAFEFNPSRIIDPLGTGLATVEEALQVTRDVWAVVIDHVAPLGDLASATVTRLDLARDFHGVDDPSTFMHAVSVLDRTYQRDSLFYRDRHTGETKSLKTGGKDNLVRIYRKDLESPGLAPPGTLRWEWQGRGQRLVQCGVATFGDITAEKVEIIAADRWAWSKMGTEVVMAHDPLAVFDALGYSGSVISKLYCDHQRLIRRGIRPKTPYARTSLNKFVAEHGLVLSCSLDADGIGRQYSQRLDWDTGPAIVVPVEPEDHSSHRPGDPHGAAVVSIDRTNVGASAADQHGQQIEPAA